MKTKFLSILMLSVALTFTAVAQDNPKNIYSVRPGFSLPMGDYNELAKPMYNYQLDWQHYLNPSFAVGLGFLSGGNGFDADKAAENVLSNYPQATMSTVEAGNYKYTALYGMFTYNLTPTKKLKVELTTRLGAVFSKYPALSVTAEDAIFYYLRSEEESANATSFYYTGALVLRYPVSNTFDLSLSNEFVGFTGNYSIDGIDRISNTRYTAKYKQPYTAIFTSIGLNWKM